MATSTKVNRALGWGPSHMLTINSPLHAKLSPLRAISRQGNRYFVLSLLVPWDCDCQISEFGESDPLLYVFWVQGQVLNHLFNRFCRGLCQVYSSKMSLIDWERETYPCNGDLLMLPAFALLFPVVRFFLDSFIFEKLARRFLGPVKGIPQDEQENQKKRHIKFKESAWKCLYYLSAEILAILVTYDEPWFTNTQNFWVGPGDQAWPDQKVKTKLKAMYMYAAGFYTYAIFALIFWETRRSDFGVSMSHHVATLILIILSYLLRFARVGSIVLAIHDASDVFLELGKMFKYGGSDILPSIFFILFVISWIVLRLIYYPFWILWSTSYEVVFSLDKSKHKIEGPIYYYVFNTLLFCLLVLHIYWWVLMYRMLVKQIQARGKLGDDVRSDSEGEEDEDD